MMFMLQSTVAEEWENGLPLPRLLPHFNPHAGAASKPVTDHIFIGIHSLIFLVMVEEHHFLIQAPNHP